jgi:hypothetical protein
VVEQ